MCLCHNSPATCVKSMPFSAASLLASGLANTLPFLGVATGTGAAAGAAGAAVGGVGVI